MSTSLPQKPLTRSAMLELYWSCGIDDRMKAGEFRWCYKSNVHPAPGRYTKPPRPHCTRSQIIAWFDASGTRVAVVHRLYHRTTRTYPDPKELLHNGVLYYVQN